MEASFDPRPAKLRAIAKTPKVLRIATMVTNTTIPRQYQGEFDCRA